MAESQNLLGMPHAPLQVSEAETSAASRRHRPGIATPVSIGTSGQNVDVCANKKWIDKTVYVGMVASSTTPLYYESSQCSY